MFGLEYCTDPAWIETVLPQRNELLVEQAHLEKKAASSAVSFLFRYPQEISLQAPLSRLAREELEHFELVLAILNRRGIPFGKQRPGHYAGALLAVMRVGEPARLLDRLLCNAVIEARSCERMKLLAIGLAGVDDEVAEFYQSLVVSEARHHGLFVSLAKGIFPVAEVARRLAEIIRHEASILMAATPMPRLHT